MNGRFVENARCPECGFAAAPTSGECPECRRMIERRMGKYKGRVSLSGVMLLVALFAVSFAAAQGESFRRHLRLRLARARDDCDDRRPLDKTV